MNRHVDFTVSTRVYFCDLHSPWQRHSNEDTNGLLHQFFPKGTDLSVYSRADLDEAERKLNRRPRKTLDWRKPHERLTEVIAQTRMSAPERKPQVSVSGDTVDIHSAALLPTIRLQSPMPTHCYPRIFAGARSRSTVSERV